MIRLDDDGQPHPLLNLYGNMRKATEHLLGICHGLIGDGALTEREILVLDTWLKNHEDDLAEWPGRVIVERVRAVLADGIITAEEAEHLRMTLDAILGGSTAERAGADGTSTRLPCEDVVELPFTGRAFCVTGAFLYGPRKRVHDAIADRGGLVAPSVSRKVDWLLIGELASRDWLYTSHGTKIEAALKLKQAGHAICIVSEQHWSRFL